MTLKIKFLVMKEVPSIAGLGYSRGTICMGAYDKYEDAEKYILARIQDTLNDAAETTTIEYWIKKVYSAE